MDTTAVGRAATRTAAVLAILLGLLAMHGLASTHHAAAGTNTQHAAQPLEDETEPHHGAVSAKAVGQGKAAVASAAPGGAGCDGDCPTTLAVLCVAVLTGAALLLARRGRAAPPPASARQDAATRAPPMRLARPPDPVTELCVSRT